jgi:hypothetical protein
MRNLGSNTIPYYKINYRAFVKDKTKQDKQTNKTSMVSTDQ